MIFRTHIAFGILMALVSIKYLNVANPYLYTAILCIAAVLPDIDESGSKIGKKLRPLSWILEKIFGHRNFFHSVCPLLILAFFFFYVLGWEMIGIASLAGYGSHILLDSFTYMGVAILYPFSRERVKGFIRTGGLAETILFILLVTAGIVTMLKML